MAGCGELLRVVVVVVVVAIVLLVNHAYHYGLDNHVSIITIQP